MNLFKQILNYIKAFWTIKLDDESKEVFTVTSDESIRLNALPDLLPKKESVWKAANDLKNFRVIDVYSESQEVLVQEIETELTFVMNVDVFDLLFSQQAEQAT